jgi:DNA helicase-2/ATP-dependent DNA helicase PcrA
MDTCLDTFFRAHNLAKLKPSLLGKKSGKGTEDSAIMRRLKQHYVAMTRPTHLLCLAMREDAFKANEIDKLKSCWRVAQVKGTDMMWL